MLCDDGLFLYLAKLYTAGLFPFEAWLNIIHTFLKHPGTATAPGHHEEGFQSSELMFTEICE